MSTTFKIKSALHTMTNPPRRIKGHIQQMAVSRWPDPRGVFSPAIHLPQPNRAAAVKYALEAPD